MCPVGFNSAPFLSGTLYSSMKNDELKAKFMQRKQNLVEQNNGEKTARELQILQISQDMVDIREGNVISALDTKLRAGGELSDKELEYLKEKNPELYQKAMEIKREREAYKKELERCKTKEDVEELYARKMQSFTFEVKAIRNNPNITDSKKRELMEQMIRRVAGIMNEHVKFITSPNGEKVMQESRTDDTLSKLDANKSQLDDLTRQVEVGQESLKAQMNQIEVRRKCMTIAIRIMNGDNVPRQDYKYLAKNDMGLYSTAITCRMQKENPKDHKRVSTEDNPDNAINGAKSLTEVDISSADEVVINVASNGEADIPVLDMSEFSLER